MPFSFPPCACNYLCWVLIASVWLRTHLWSSDCFRGDFRAFLATTVWLQSLLSSSDCFCVATVTPGCFRFLPRSLHASVATSMWLQSLPVPSLWLMLLPCRSDYIQGYFGAFLTPAVWLQSLPGGSDCFRVVRTHPCGSDCSQDQFMPLWLYLCGCSHFLYLLCGCPSCVAVISVRF